MFRRPYIYIVHLHIYTYLYKCTCTYTTYVYTVYVHGGVLKGGTPMVPQWYPNGTPIVGWFILENLTKTNGWFRGYPHDLGNLHISSYFYIYICMYIHTLQGKKYIHILYTNNIYICISIIYIYIYISIIYQYKYSKKKKTLEPILGIMEHSSSPEPLPQESRALGAQGGCCPGTSDQIDLRAENLKRLETILI